MTPINTHAHSILGGDDPLKETYHYLTTKGWRGGDGQGQAEPKTIRICWCIFASMMLDPEGHKKWLDDVRNPNN